MVQFGWLNTASATTTGGAVGLKTVTGGGVGHITMLDGVHTLIRHSTLR